MVNNINENVSVGGQVPTETLPKKKRGRKPNPNKNNMYFSEKEEMLFREYCTTTDQFTKNKIFKEHLYPAFCKMVESIIRRYVLFTPGEEYTDTFHDAMSYLISKIENFDVTKNKKAYSYCGTICKNYVLFKRQKAQDSLQKNSSYDVIYNETNPDLRTVEPSELGEKDLPQTLMEFIADKINEMLETPARYGLDENDIKVGEALVYMMTNWDEIFPEITSQKYNKSQVEAYLKQLTFLTTKEVRASKKKFTEYYIKLKSETLENEDE